MLVLIALTAQAATLVVDAGGSGDYTSINAAIEAASAGDTVLVKNGDYTEARAYSLYNTTVNEYFYFAGVLTVDKTISIIGESTNGVRVRTASVAAGSYQRAAAILLTKDAGEVSIRNLTIESGLSGGELLAGGHHAYTVVTHASFYDGSELPGTLSLYQVAVRLSDARPKAIIYANSPTRSYDFDHVSLSLSGDTTSNVFSYCNHFGPVLSLTASIVGVFQNGNVIGPSCSDIPLTSSYLLLDGPTETSVETNAVGQPSYVDLDGLDMRLASGSLGVDAGPEEELDADGSASDLGAFGGEALGFPLDQDGDGFSADGSIGDAADCNDSDDAVSPSSEEVCGNAVDDDCDGEADPVALCGEPDTDLPGETGDTPDPEDPKGQDDSGGCGCDHGGPTGAVWLGLILAIPLLRRRRS